MSTKTKKPKSKPKKITKTQQKPKGEVFQALPATEVQLDEDAYSRLEPDTLQGTETQSAVRETTPRVRRSVAQPIAGASGAVPVEPEKTLRISLSSAAHVVQIAAAIGSTLAVLFFIFKWYFTVDSKLDSLTDSDKEQKAHIQTIDTQGRDSASAIMVIKRDVEQIRTDVSELRQQSK